MKYGLTIENQNLIIDKAKEKKDGVYSFRGVDYRVKDGKVLCFASNGKIIQSFGNFNVEIGNYRYNYDNIKKILMLMKFN